MKKIKDIKDVKIGDILNPIVGDVGKVLDIVNTENYEIILNKYDNSDHMKRIIDNLTKFNIIGFNIVVIQSENEDQRILFYTDDNFVSCDK